MKLSTLPAGTDVAVDGDTPTAPTGLEGFFALAEILTEAAGAASLVVVSFSKDSVAQFFCWVRFLDQKNTHV